MISLLAIPPGDMSVAALLLVIGPGLIGLQVEAVILLVVGRGLTGGSATKEVEGADSFLDFFGAFLEVDVLPFSFLLLEFFGAAGGISTVRSVGGSVQPFSICPNWKHLLHW